MPNTKSLGLHGKAWAFLNQYRRYAHEASNAGLDLEARPLKRQFETAALILDRLNGSNGTQAQGGILLADDAGLGKTLVAAIVAWIIARAGDKDRKVRILAPNDRVVERWKEELNRHVAPLNIVAPNLDIRQEHVRDLSGGLRKGLIEVTTHGRSLKRSLDCSLLIVDEAHKAKSVWSRFHQHLLEEIDAYDKILFLTATPFSIDVGELTHMLSLAGAEIADPIQAYVKVLDGLYEIDGTESIDDSVKELIVSAEAAINTIEPWVVRHGIQGLSKLEKWSVGEEATIRPDKLLASDTDIEAIIRADRVLRMNRVRSRTNDPRFHVGLAQLRHQLSSAQTHAKSGIDNSILTSHINRINLLLPKRAVHPKIQAVANLVAEIVNGDRGYGHEKVLVFCHHLAVATEFGEALRRLLPSAPAVNKDVLFEALEKAIPKPHGRARTGLPDDYRELRHSFLSWMTRPGLRAQIAEWIGGFPPTAGRLAQALRRPIRGIPSARISVAEAAASELHDLLYSPSDNPLRSALLKRNWTNIPGTERRQRILAIHGSPIRGKNVPDSPRDESIARRVFNSPFGPDVLITTDKLAEGIDLHRWCRIVIHYELDPSPIRIIQRNGRIRRVGCWAARLEKPVEFHYPTFHGTRDERLVDTIRHRLQRFDLLLGHVGGQVHPEDDDSREEQWRKKVLDQCKHRLASLNEKLQA